MKKILGVVLALCMLCGLVPLTAAAESTLYDVTVTGADYTVADGAVGADAFDGANSSLELELKSEAGVILSETISVTVGGEVFSNYYSYFADYDASDDTVTLYIHIGNDAGGRIDGDVVITLYEETSPRVETLFPTATAVTEDTQFKDTYTAGLTYYMAPFMSSMETAYDAKVYAVELEADQELWVSSYSYEDTDGDTWVLIYRETSDGYEYESHIDHDSKNGLQESFIFTAPEDGKYYFVCSHYGDAEGEYVNAFSYDIPGDMTPYLETAPPLANTTVSCEEVEYYMLEGEIYGVLAAFKTDEQQDFLLGSDDENAVVSYMILYKDPDYGYLGAMGGEIGGGSKELLTLGTEEILLLLETGKEPYDVSIKLMDPAVTDVLDFTATPVPTPSESDKWAWDAGKKELTLKDGFNMRTDTLSVDAEEAAIVLPDGATVIIDGDVYITSTGYPLKGMGALAVKGKTGRADTLGVSCDMWAILAKKDLLIENCTVSGLGGFLSSTNVTINNVKAKIVGLALAAAAGDSIEDETEVVIKNSDITFSGMFPAMATEKVSIENCVSHIFTMIEMDGAVGQIAPLQVSGGAMAWSGMVGSFVLDLVQVDENAEFMLIGGDGLSVIDKANLPTAENISLYNMDGDVIYEGALNEDVLFYDEEAESYYIAVEKDGGMEWAMAITTAYLADIADAKVVSDAKEYAHDAVIKVDATALTPVVGVHGNTRLLPVSWKVGELEGMFEDGKYTIELNAADLGVGEHTVVVTYAYDEKMSAAIQSNWDIPLLKSFWEAAEWPEEGVELTASTTFKVLAKPTTPPPGEGGGDGDGVPAPIVPTPTGDNVSTLPWLVLTVASALGLVVLAVTKKRKV